MSIYDINGNVIYNSSSLYDNCVLDYKFDETTNANYTVLRIYQTKKDGTKQIPFVRCPDASETSYSALDLANMEKWGIIINAGLGVPPAYTADGVVIQNGIMLHDAPTTYHVGALPLTIDDEGNLGYASADVTGATLISQGVISALLGFCPIIVDYLPVNPPTVQHVSHFTENAQRQIIGQFGNGDYAIITCEGRNFNNSDGWTIAEAQTICQKLGLKFAYNLDGGGSTETVLGKKPINTIYENTTGRKIASFIVFNGKSSFEIPNS